MKQFTLILLFCHVSSPVKHSLKFFFTGSSGIPNFPVFVGAAEVDQIQAASCDSNKQMKARQNWVNKIMWTDREQLNWYKEECFEIQPYFFKDTINDLMERFNQTGGVHILQRISGCEWDVETGEVDGFMLFGYDAEDFISFDEKTLTWIALKPKGITTKLSWDADKTRMKHYKNYLTQVCPKWLKMYVDYGKSSLLRKDLPSVSLLQKSPSSPVTCHASGFYPNSAVMFWKKDGEELHKDVELGEILPNHDGSFQMSVDLNVSSVTPEDWGRYECVFQLSDVEDQILTRLDGAVIRTNWGKSVSSYVKEAPNKAAVLVVVVVLLIVIHVAVLGSISYSICLGVTIHKKNKDNKHVSSSASCEESRSLNSETASTNPQPCNKEEEKLNTSKEDGLS